MTQFFKIASPERGYSFDKELPSNKSSNARKNLVIAPNSNRNFVKENKTQDNAKITEKTDASIAYTKFHTAAPIEKDFDTCNETSCNKQKKVLEILEVANNENEKLETEKKIQKNVNHSEEVNFLESNHEFNRDDSFCDSTISTVPNKYNDLDEKEILELHVNPERAKYKKFKLPKYDLCAEMKCDSCKRNSTQSTNIEIRMFQPSRIHQLKGKLYGALTMNKIYTVDQTRQFKFCYFCNEYYSHSSGDFAEWKHVWPSFIFTAMKSRNTKYDVLKQALPIILPLEIKRMWSSEIQEFTNERNVFSFRSNDLNLFLENVTSSLGGFVQMLNNYCFPDVKCPLGCWQFMDYCQEIPLHHYLHYKFNFKLRSSNPKLFISSRKDWPSTDLFLRWKIKPALVISKKNGLSILVCKYHTHNDLSLKYFHLLKSPYYNFY